MEHSSRHLRFKLQSLSRRLDDLEEATRNLQKAEDEVLDLQDKIIQAEGSNSSMLAEVEGLRKRVLKIEGKDEEVKKAEDLCRLIKEKLENEENITRELRLEIDQLQKRMSELEKLEEAFSKSKSDCSQLCLSLNEEKNMSKKLSSELELLRTRVRELESSETRLDKAEQLLTSELEKIKSLSVSFANERKRFLDREKQNEKLILELREQLEVKEKIIREQTRNESNLLERSSDQHGERNRIEDSLSSKTSQRVGSDYVKQSEIQTSSENEKNKHQEDNKIKELNQEIEKLRNRLKHFEDLEEELKQLKEKYCELQESFICEQKTNKRVTEELQTLKRRADQFKEVENGVLDNDLSHNQIKNERTKNKVASTEPPISKYSSRDVSAQQLRSERSRNSDFLYKRQLSNSSSSSRKSSRSPLNDTTIGNLRKQEDKISESSYFPSGKDFGSSQNEFKKNKDQPSVLSRYPPAVQDQTTPKSWKSSTSKQTDRSIKLFGEDYSNKANSKKEISVDNVEIKEQQSEDFSENTKLHGEIVPVENCSVSARIDSELNNHSTDFGNGQENGNFNVENELKPGINSEDIDIKLTSRNRFSKYSGSSGGDDHITNNNNEHNESKQKSLILEKEVDPQSNQTPNTQRSYYTRDKTRSKASKPLIPEKPHILESLEYREPDRRTKLSGLHRKGQSSPKEKFTLQENMRTSSFENHIPAFQREVVTESFRKISSSDGLENTEINSRSATRTRSCSPRESLQSKMIIKPIIIEKDMKESMSDYRARSSSESSRSPVNVTPNKVTSSIKIYPSESSRASIDEPTRERHTSTSNIRLSANDQPVLKNNISIPFEISINKEDMVFKVSNTDKNLDRKEITKTIDHRLGKEQAKGIDNETVPWKSHNRFETNHVDSKFETVRSSWRKGLYGSTEELDRIDRDFSETKSRRKSCFDEEKPVRLRNHEQYSKNKSLSVGSWNATPDFISKRSQSTLTATEIVSRRNKSYDSLSSSSSSYSSWSRSSVEVDDSFSLRRKYTNERMARTDSAGWRQAQNPRQKGMVEERIRQLEH